LNGSYKISYKTRNMAYEPIFPFEKNNPAIHQVSNLFDGNVRQENYKTKMYPDLKSYIIIPIHYFDNSYGNIVLGYKKKQIFKQEDLTLYHYLGNTIAQTITINWVIENENRALVLAEKQKETEVSLEQEKLKTEFI